MVVPTATSIFRPPLGIAGRPPPDKSSHLIVVFCGPNQVVDSVNLESGLATEAEFTIRFLRSLIALPEPNLSPPYFLMGNEDTSGF